MSNSAAADFLPYAAEPGVACVGARSAGSSTAKEIRAALARWRVAVSYSWRHRRLLDLETPVRFTELVQLRKLHDRSPDQVELMDKVAAKRLAAAALGSEWVVPTLWSGTALPDAVPFPSPPFSRRAMGAIKTPF